MIEAYLLAERIQGELNDLSRTVERVKGALDAARQRSVDQDYFIDSVALNLHDFYAGLERIFNELALLWITISL